MDSPDSKPFFHGFVNRPSAQIAICVANGLSWFGHIQAASRRHVADLKFNVFAQYRVRLGAVFK